MATPRIFCRILKMIKKQTKIDKKKEIRINFFFFVEKDFKKKKTLLLFK